MAKKRYVSSAEREAKRVANRIAQQKYRKKLKTLPVEEYECFLDNDADRKLEERANESKYKKTKRLKSRGRRQDG